MAEYWCGSQKGWVSDKGKSVADIINAQPKKYSGAQGNGQMYITIIPRTIFHPTYREGNPYIYGGDVPADYLKKDDIHVLKNRRGVMIVYRGEPRNYYPEYFMLNE